MDEFKIRKKKILVIFSLIFIAFFVSNISATDVSTCTAISSSGTYDLNTSLNCANDGIQLKASNIIFDCHGYAINYSSSGAENDRGIEFWGTLTNITVKNCIVKMTNTTSTNLYRQGIVVYDNSNATIFNTSVEVWGDNPGIEAWGNSGMTGLNISNVNTLSHEGGGIAINDYSSNSILEYSNITSYKFGLDTWTGADNPQIIGNKFNTTGTSWSSIFIQNIHGANITGNNIYSSYDGINIQSSVTQTILVDNNILSSNTGMSISSNGSYLNGNNITSTSYVGLYLVGSNINVTNSNITSYGYAVFSSGANNNLSNSILTSTGNYAFYISGTSDDTSISNTNISRTSAGSTLYMSTGADREYFNNVKLNSATARGFYISGTSNNLTIINSNITSGTEGIYVGTGGTGWNLTNNIVTSGGSSFFLPGIDNSYFGYNNITTTGTNAYGIYLNDISNILEGDRIINTGANSIGFVLQGSTTTGNNVSYLFINSSGDSARSIYLGNGATEIILSNSTFISNGAGFSPAIYISGSNINITNVNSTSSTYAIYLYTGTSNLTIQNNNLNSTSGQGIVIESNSSNHLIEYNAITSYEEGILFYSFSENSKIQHNTINSTDYMGIRLTDENDNTTIYNNTIITRDDEGIYVYDTTNLNISSNTITSGRNGIYLEQSSSNILDKNNIFHYYNGILLEYSNDNNITNGNINATGNTGNDACIKSKSSLRNNIENVSIYLDYTYGQGIYFLDNSEENNVLNTNITFKPTSYGWGLFFNSDNNNATNVNIINTYSSSLTYASGNYCLLLRDANGNIVSDSILNCPNSVNIANRGATTEKNYVVNTTFNSSKVVWHLTENSQILSVQWYLDAQVNDSLGSPIENATISIYDLFSTLEVSKNSSINGSASKLRMTEYEQNATNKIFFTPTMVNVTSNIYYTNSTSFNITELQNVAYSFILTSDTTPPEVSIGNISTYVGSRNFNFNSTMSDIKPITCKYSIFYSNGTLDSSNENISFTCNLNPISAITSVFGTFNLTVYVRDTAGNENSTTKEFTTKILTGGGGGGSGEVEKIPTIAIKSINSSTTYTDLQKAIFYSRINSYCSQVETGDTLTVVDYSKECSLTKSDVEKIKSNLLAEGITISTEDLILFYSLFSNGNLDQIYETMKIIEEYNLFTSVLGITNPITVYPARLDKPFVIFKNEGNITIEYTFTVNKDIKSCSVLSGEGFSCELLSSNSFKMILVVNDTNFFDELFKGEFFVTSDAEGDNTEVTRIYLSPIIYNLSYKIGGLPSYYFIIAILIIIISLSIFMVFRSRLNKNIRSS